MIGNEISFKVDATLVKELQITETQADDLADALSACLIAELDKMNLDWKFVGVGYKPD